MEVEFQNSICFVKNKKAIDFVYVKINFNGIFLGQRAIRVISDANMRHCRKTKNAWKSLSFHMRETLLQGLLFLVMTRQSCHLIFLHRCG
jgi:hypothetical protein